MLDIFFKIYYDSVLETSLKKQTKLIRIMKRIIIHARSCVSLWLLKSFVDRNVNRTFFGSKELMGVATLTKWSSDKLIVDRSDFFEKLSNCFSPCEVKSGQSAVIGYKELDETLNSIDQKRRLVNLPRVH